MLDEIISYNHVQAIIYTDIEIGFKSRSITVEEPADSEIILSNQTIIIKDRPSEQTFIFDLETIGFCLQPSVAFATLRRDPANQDGDYDVVTATSNLIFPPELQTITVDIAIFGDNRIEGRECFCFDIRNTFGPLFRTNFFEQNQVVFIADNSTLNNKKLYSYTIRGVQIWHFDVVVKSLVYIHDA